MALTPEQQNAYDSFHRLRRAEFEVHRRIHDSDDSVEATSVIAELLSARKAEEVSLLPFDDGFASLQSLSLRSFFPQESSATTTLTPTALGQTTCRVFPFHIPRVMPLSQVVIKTPAAVVGGYQFGIFNDTGQRVWHSGPVTTVVGYTTIVVAPLVVLTSGQYYFGVTNNGTVSGTGGLSISQALSGLIARWGTISAIGGSIPTTITPGSIVKTTGGFPVYVVLSGE